MNKKLLVGLIGIIAALGGFVVIDQYFRTDDKVQPVAADSLKSIGYITLPDGSKQLIFQIKGDGIVCIQTFHVMALQGGYYDRIFPQLECR